VTSEDHSRYLDFREGPPAGKTGRWFVVSWSRGDSLGVIKWFGRWRQYCFFPEPETVWNRDCLKDVTAFIAKQMEARKRGSE
jgi:hypothetical protein